MGLANNRLTAINQDWEAGIAKQLLTVGIFFIVECAYNIAGLLVSRAEYMFREEPSFASMKPRLESICGDNVRRLLDDARRADKTPSELVYDKVENAIYSRIPFGELLN